MPQLPFTSVVTPWRILAGSGSAANGSASEWQWTSTKPGQTVRPVTSTTLARLGRVQPPEGCDPAVLDGHIGQYVHVAGAVQDPAAAQDQIEHRTLLTTPASYPSLAHRRSALSSRKRTRRLRSE